MVKTTVIACAALVASAGLASAQTVFGVTDTNSLVTWEASSPGSIVSGVAIQGLAQNEQIRGIDFRPATGELFALGSFSNLYTVNTSTGAASQVGSTFANTLNGSSFGFDFNPTIDRIRVVSDANQNLVLNPNDGTSNQVTPLFYAAGDPNFGMDPSVVASAYTNSFAGATSSQLYGLDTSLDVLVTQANSAGTLMTVGSLGADLNDTASFDIFSFNGQDTAFATVQDFDLGRSTFWTIDLQTGAATMIGEVGGGAIIRSMAVVPAPGAIAVAGLGGLAMARRRR